MTTLIGRRSQTEGHKATIWILAALSLPYKERIEAMSDIAQMLNTTYALVQSAASKLKAKRQAEAVQAGYGEARAAYQAAPFRPHGRLPVPPSELRQLTKAELMVGKAR